MSPLYKQGALDALRTLGLEKTADAISNAFGRVPLKYQPLAAGVGIGTPFAALQGLADSDREDLSSKEKLLRMLGAGAVTGLPAAGAVRTINKGFPGVFSKLKPHEINPFLH